MQVLLEKPAQVVEIQDLGFEKAVAQTTGFRPRA